MPKDGISPAVRSSCLGALALSADIPAAVEPEPLLRMLLDPETDPAVDLGHHLGGVLAGDRLLEADLEAAVRAVSRRADGNQRRSAPSRELRGRSRGLGWPAKEIDQRRAGDSLIDQHHRETTRPDMAREAPHPLPPLLQHRASDMGQQRLGETVEEFIVESAVDD